MKARAPTKKTVALTIGHSDRSLSDFLDLLQKYHVALVADVRKMPFSRGNPQFNQDALPQALKGFAIEYIHFPGLGGLRPRRKDSPNTGWQNRSFQGYADFMLTAEFEQSLNELVKRLHERQTAIMCAEAVPWRCHRSLIADALCVRGIDVKHILSAARLQPHELRPWAQVEGTRITYPAGQSEPCSA